MIELWQFSVDNKMLKILDLFLVYIEVCTNTFQKSKFSLMSNPIRIIKKNFHNNLRT